MAVKIIGLDRYGTSVARLMSDAELFAAVADDSSTRMAKTWALMELVDRGYEETITIHFVHSASRGTRTALRNLGWNVPASVPCGEPVDVYEFLESRYGGELLGGDHQDDDGNGRTWPGVSWPPTPTADDIAHLRKTALSPVPKMRGLVARHSFTPAEVLALLVDDPNLDVLIGVAGHPAASRKVLRDLAQHRNKDVQLAVAANQSSPPSALRVLSESPHAEVALTVAANPSAGAQILSELAESPDPEMWKVVAANPATPATILRRLSSQWRWLIHTSRPLSHNPSTPAAVLEELAHDIDIDTLVNVASHPKASRAVFETLSAHPHPSVLTAVAEHCPHPAILDRFVLDPDLDVVVALAGNPAITLDAQFDLASDEHITVRQALANNPNLSDHAARELLNSPDAGIASRAIEHLSDDYLTDICRAIKDGFDVPFDPAVTEAIMRENYVRYRARQTHQATEVDTVQP